MVPVFDWKSRLSEVPVIGYATKVVHDLCLLPVLRRDILSELQRDRERVDAAMPREQFVAATADSRRQTEALEQKTGALTQHLKQLLDHRAETESRLHDLDQKLGDLGLVVNSLPGALREARRSERSATRELEVLRSEVGSAVRLMDLARDGAEAGMAHLAAQAESLRAEVDLRLQNEASHGQGLGGRLLAIERLLAQWEQRIERTSAALDQLQRTTVEEHASAQTALGCVRADLGALSARQDRAFAEYPESIAALTVRVTDLSAQSQKSDLAAQGQAKNLKDLQEELKAAGGVAQERLHRATAELQSLVGELTSRMHRLAEHLQKSDETAQEQPRRLKELEGQMEAAEGAAREGLCQATAEFQRLVSELNGRLDRFAEHSEASEKAARGHAKNIEECGRRLETVEGALEEATRLTSTEVQEIERALQDFREEIRAAPDGGRKHAHVK
jgi:chromosome segregation ATPase